MKKLSDKISHAAHIKTNTAGTSNEISFSVLDAAKRAQDGESQGASVPELPGLGVISLFTLGRGKKPRSTPAKEKGFFLPSGEFVSTEEGSSGSFIAGGGTPGVVKPVSGAGSAGVGGAAGAGSGLPGAAGSPSPLGNEGSLTASVAEAAGSAAAMAGGAAAAAVGGVVGAMPKPAQKAESWSTPQDEVKRRKKTRKRRKFFALAALCVAGAVALGVGGMALMNYLEEQQTTRGQLMGFIGMVEEADNIVLEFDELVVTQINGGMSELGTEALASSYNDMKDDLAQAYDDLARAKILVEQVLIDLTDPNDIEAANQAIASINARLNMIEIGQIIIEEMISGQTAAQEAAAGWASLLVGDDAAREAAGLVANMSVESVQASKARSTEALEAFKVAHEKLSQAAAAYEGLDISAYVTYAATRVEAQEHAIASDQAYLDRNKEALAAEADAYNQLDASAAEMAKSLAGDPGVLIEEHMNATLESTIASYSSERSQAGSADAILRDYLGIKAD